VLPRNTGKRIIKVSDLFPIIEKETKEDNQDNSK
jgi:hypothetical protein